jgi:hypothetical protein
MGTGGDDRRRGGPWIQHCGRDTGNCTDDDSIGYARFRKSIQTVSDFQLATVPNPTSWATAFAPCKRYASILSSCATATASFYDLEYDQQASCVCYQASTNTAACQAVPTLDLSYDVDEYQCWNFLNKTGAIAIADVMDQALVLPGPVLCDWAISQTDFSMPSTLSPTTVTCAVSTPTPTAPVAARVGDQAAQLLTASDVQILVSATR